VATSASSMTLRLLEHCRPHVFTSWRQYGSARWFVTLRRENPLPDAVDSVEKRGAVDHFAIDPFTGAQTGDNSPVAVLWRCSGAPNWSTGVNVAVGGWKKFGLDACVVVEAQGRGKMGSYFTRKSDGAATAEAHCTRTEENSTGLLEFSGCWVPCSRRVGSSRVLAGRGKLRDGRSWGGNFCATTDAAATTRGAGARLDQCGAGRIRPCWPRAQSFPASAETALRLAGWWCARRNSLGLLGAKLFGRPTRWRGGRRSRLSERPRSDSGYGTVA